MTNTDQLLRALVSRYVEHPADLKITHQVAEDRSVYWMIRGNPLDDGCLVGVKGSHVDALTFLLHLWGTASRQVYTLRVITQPRQAERRRSDPRDVLEYNPAGALTLLNNVLATLPIGDFKTEVGPGHGPRDNLTFLFAVRLRSLDDYRYLTIPPVPFGDGRFNETTAEAAIGTLFRAIAKREGVRFNLSILKP